MRPGGAADGRQHHLPGRGALPEGRVTHGATAYRKDTIYQGPSPKDLSAPEKLCPVHGHTGGGGKTALSQFSAKGKLYTIHRQQAQGGAGQRPCALFRCRRAGRSLPGRKGGSEPSGQRVEAHHLPAAGGCRAAGLRQRPDVEKPAHLLLGGDGPGDEDTLGAVPMVRRLSRRGPPPPCPHGLLQRRYFGRS